MAKGYRVRVTETRWVMRGSKLGWIKISSAPGDPEVIAMDPGNPNAYIEYRALFTKRAAEQFLEAAKQIPAYANAIIEEA
jgi:hypothetical protein